MVDQDLPRWASDKSIALTFNYSSGSSDPRPLQPPAADTIERRIAQFPYDSDPLVLIADRWDFSGDNTNNKACRRLRRLARHEALDARRSFSSASLPLSHSPFHSSLSLSLFHSHFRVSLRREPPHIRELRALAKRCFEQTILLQIGVCRGQLEGSISCRNPLSARVSASTG